MRAPIGPERADGVSSIAQKQRSRRKWIQVQAEETTMVEVLPREAAQVNCTMFVDAYFAAELGRRSQAGRIPAVTGNEAGEASVPPRINLTKLVARVTRTGELALEPADKGQDGKNQSINQSCVEDMAVPQEQDEGA